MKYTVFVLLLVGCADPFYERRPGKPIPGGNRMVDFVPVAYVDRHMAEHVSGVLGAAGIHAQVGSTMDYRVAVPAEQKARALELLRKDAEDHHYRISP